MGRNLNVGVDLGGTGVGAAALDARGGVRDAARLGSVGENETRAAQHCSQGRP